jgi:hypothetical protein
MRLAPAAAAAPYESDSAGETPAEPAADLRGQFHVALLRARAATITG